MVDAVNLNNISVDDTGRVSVSGAGSGIDFVSAVDNIIAARRIPVDRLEANSSENSEKIAALDSLRSLMSSLSTSVNNLRGRVTFGNTGNVFASKEVFASSSRTSGTPSAAGNLLGVSVTNAAEAGSHNIEILQTASAHKISGDTAASKTQNMGLAYGDATQSISGAFEINGRRITVQPSDTLIDLKDRINTANSGASATGVTASIVSVSASQHILVLTADETGESIDIAKSHRLGGSTVTNATDDLGTALGLGVGTVAGAFEVNGVQIDVTANDTLTSLVDKINGSGAGATAAVLTENGSSRLILTTSDASQDITLATSHRVGSGTATDITSDLGTARGLGAGTVAGTFDVNGTTVTIDAADSLESLRDKINAADAGATAKIITNGANDFTLAITSDDASQPLALDNETGGVLADLGISADGGTSFQNELSVSQNVLADLGLSNDDGASFLSVLSDSNDVLDKLGISSDGGTTFSNELRLAQTAKFKADGLIDVAASQTAGVASETTAYGVTGNLLVTLPDASDVTIAVGAADTPEDLRDAINADSDLQAAGISATIVEDDDGLFRVEIRQSALTSDDPSGVLALKLADPAVTAVGVDDNLTFSFGDGQIAQIAVTSTDTLDEIRDAINADGDLQAAGVSAQVVADGNNFKLVVQHDQDIDVAGPAGLGLETPDLILERSSNTVSDVFAGVTLTLFQSEVGTTVKLDVEQNLSSAKDDIFGFVEAYNAVRSFINEQRLKDPETGGKSEDAGPLYGNPTLTNIETNLARIIGQGAEGLDSGFQVLREVGIEFVDNNSVDDSLLLNTLTIDETVLDEKLLNDPDGVEKLFAFDFSSSDPQISLLSFTRNTKVAAEGYKLDVTMTDGVITGATINGVAGSATVSGSTITATDKTSAQGLKIIYTGSSSASDIQLDISSGLGSNLFFEIDRLLDEDTGSLELEVSNLTDRNEANLERIERMVDRLNYQRQELLSRFVSMEEALLSMNNTLDTIRQQIDAMSSDS